MTHMQLDSIIINPKHAATHSVIWMHGLGADGYDFVDIIPQLRLPEDLAIRFVFPHAPTRSVTLAQGMSMRAWFDLGLTLDAPQDESGIRASQAQIERLIAQEVASGIPVRNIILAGFSQGGAMALQCGLRYPESLGGILSLSGFLLLAETVPQEKHITNQNTPILLMHGMQDTRVPVTYAEQATCYLAGLGFNVKLQTYDMEHAVCAKQISDIGMWLRDVFLGNDCSVE